ncbi:MAG: phage tail sheath subtilisin-like domain-containing protein [Longimicrobiales bacterium]
MPVKPTYPGVYVQEVPSGVRTIVGASTSVALFVGRTAEGPMNVPVECVSYGDFLREFTADARYGDLPRYVKLFFQNGGTQCWILRIANGASAATVTLRSENDVDVLTLTAKQMGVLGETIRAVVTYSGSQPEVTFNLDVFRMVIDGAGRRQVDGLESWKNLTMDPASPLFAPDVLEQNSKLVTGSVAAGAPAAAAGSSRSGRPVPYDSGTPTTFRDAWEARLGDAAPTTSAFEITVDGSAWVEADLSGIDVGSISAASLNTVRNGLAAAIKSAIETSFTTAGVPGVVVTVDFVDGPAPPAADGNATSFLRIRSSATGNVFVRPASSNDLAVPLMLGTGQGGVEVGAHAARRPAASGMVLDADTADLNAFAALAQNTITSITLPDVEGTALGAVAVDLDTAGATQPMYRSGGSSPATGENDGVREKLGLLRDAINARSDDDRDFPWQAEVWGTRLAILPTAGADNFRGTIATAPTDVSARFVRSLRRYTVGKDGAATFQVPAGAPASDGSPPLLTDYEAAFRTADKETDFNLLLLPPDRESGGATQESLWGAGSVFCQQKRAFLLMDPPASWTSAQAAKAGVDTLRTGLVKDHAALYFPRLVMNENGRLVTVGPTGAIAGLMGRIDSSRGVWKAPAGTEADLRGIVGVERPFTDAENGLVNPRAINMIRSFPNGIVSWGARTMDGDDDFGSEYKYVPIRRLALFIEESLYNGLKWVVFEPNDHPLWAQIRLNVGAFMQDLFRKGAFEGKTPKEAYFVRCDGETTPPNDRNLGIVNIWVGFAPLKPAEFVILHLQQKTALADA